MSPHSGGRLTRDERIARQAEDDGDPDAPVYLAQGGAYGSHFYHDDQDCPKLKKTDAIAEVTRRAAQLKWRAPCSECVL